MSKGMKSQNNLRLYFSIVTQYSWRCDIEFYYITKAVLQLNQCMSDYSCGPIKRNSGPIMRI